MSSNSSGCLINPDRMVGLCPSSPMNTKLFTAQMRQSCGVRGKVGVEVVKRKVGRWAHFGLNLTLRAGGKRA